jgi:hypothetical protein
MQLTRFDRWLREKFVYHTHIHTLRPPETLPPGIRKIEIPEIPGQRYKHLYAAKSSKNADALIAQLKSDSQMYTTQIVDSTRWYVPIIAPKTKSFTWTVISIVLITCSVISVLLYAKTFAEDPVFMKYFWDAVKLFKTG